MSKLDWERENKKEALPRKRSQYTNIYGSKIPITKKIEKKKNSSSTSGKYMKSLYPGRCNLCNRMTSKGSDIVYDGKANHVNCYEEKFGTK